MLLTCSFNVQQYVTRSSHLFSADDSAIPRLMNCKNSLDTASETSWNSYAKRCNLNYTSVKIIKHNFNWHENIEKPIKDISFSVIRPGKIISDELFSMILSKVITKNESLKYLQNIPGFVLVFSVDFWRFAICKEAYRTTQYCNILPYSKHKCMKASQDV